MRKTFIILCIWSIIVGCSQETKEEDTSSKEKEGWKLVWEDDFNRDDIFATHSPTFWRLLRLLSRYGRSLQRG